jgi:hypothetical protein
MSVAVLARAELADLLALAGDAFEALAIDPDELFAKLRSPPDGLFKA